MLRKAKAFIKQSTGEALENAGLLLKQLLVNKIEVKAMKQENQRGRWGVFFEEFSKQNKTRPTRLGKIKADEVTQDYWLEDGLPLAGIDLDKDGEGAPLIEIMLGGEGVKAEGNMTHTVTRVQRIKFHLTADGMDDGLDIEDSEGMTTILRFEPLLREI